VKKQDTKRRNLDSTPNTFKNISHRGRIGYTLCCLENTIAHQGLNHPRWQIVLDLVWKGTESDYELLETDFTGITPYRIFNYSNFATYTYAHPPRASLDETYNAETEAEYNELRMIYEQSDVANALLMRISGFAADPIYGMNDQYVLKKIKEIIHMMDVHSIPLPDINLFTSYIPITDSGIPLMGAPFTRSDIFGR
jgi:hypothetical protein